jgi:hypothetical protein
VNRRNGALSGAGLVLAVLVLSGCATSDEIYVSNFSDAHGRACTFVYTAREGEGFGGSGRDVDVSQLDCEYPPEGRSPAPPTTTHFNAVPTGE